MLILVSNNNEFFFFVEKLMYFFICFFSSFEESSFFLFSIVLIGAFRTIHKCGSGNNFKIRLDNLLERLNLYRILSINKSCANLSNIIS